MGRNLLLTAAICSAIATVLHLACIVFGGDWYRFLGAGEHMAQLAEAGDPYPTIVTSLIASVLFVWTMYALSGAGVILRLPLLRLVLVLVSVVYLARGFAFPLLMPMFPGNSATFWLVSSGICILFGLFYAIGTWKSWHILSIGYTGNAN